MGILKWVSLAQRPCLVWKFTRKCLRNLLPPGLYLPDTSFVLSFMDLHSYTKTFPGYPWFFHFVHLMCSLLILLHVYSFLGLLLRGTWIRQVNSSALVSTGWQVGWGSFCLWEMCERIQSSGGEFKTMNTPLSLSRVALNVPFLSSEEFNIVLEF